MIRGYQKISQHPGIIAGAIILLAGVFIYGVVENAQIVTDLDEYMPSDHPAFVFSDQAEEQFGIQDSILIAVEHPESVYNSGTLEKIKSISVQLAEKLDEVEAEDMDTALLIFRWMRHAGQRPA